MAVVFPVLFLWGCGAASQVAGPPQLPQIPPPQSAPPVPEQSGSVTIAPAYAALGPGQAIKFTAASSSGGSISWLVNEIPGGNSSVGTVDANGNYTAPAVPLSTNVVVKAVLSASPVANYATATLAVIVAGQLTPTANPQVVAYSIYLPAPGDAAIQFGTSVQGGLNTWSQPTPSPNGGLVQIYVAGMLAGTQYHMHAAVKLDNGVAFQDVDHTFTTGTPPETAAVAAITSNGQEPQNGIELFDTLIPSKPAEAFATDLQGNVLWTYSYQGSNIDAVQPIKLLPNGHFLVLISFASSLPSSIASNPPTGTIDVVREVDLAGNTIRELTLGKPSSFSCGSRLQFQP